MHGRKKNPREKSSRARQCLQALLAAVIVAVVPVAASAATSNRLVPTAMGYNPDGAAMIDGPRWVRLWDSNVDWAQLEPQRGQFDWSTLDSRVAEAAQHHQRVILTLGITPMWAAPSGATETDWLGGCTCPPVSIYDWNYYVSTVAMRYGTKIAAYEPWNEPDLPDFYTGSEAELAHLSHSAYNDIHAHVKPVTVLSPAWCCWSGTTWLRHFIQHGGRKFMDALAIHDYPQKARDIGPFIESYRTTMTKLKVSKQIWITEMGCNTNMAPDCQYSNPMKTGAFARTELHTVHMHNIPVALWYPLDGGGGPWMGLNSVSPYLLAYAN